VPADANTLKSSAGITGSVAFSRPDSDVPASPLFLDGRKQDLAFEKPIDACADRRNHVRFWKALCAGVVAWPLSRPVVGRDIDRPGVHPG
jgi:hypothetical protein